MTAAQKRGGPFRGGLDPQALRFSSSLDVDRRLYHEDIEGSLAHVTMLARRKIIDPRDAAAIRKALLDIGREIERGSFFNADGRTGRGRFVAEDIHMAIEHRLIQKIGPRGGKLHTGRSRNDQVATDERIYLRKTVARIISAIRTLQRSILGRAERYHTIVMPGYTHLQPAQPILLAHHLLAYVSMLERDRERLSDCLKRVRLSPLGAGAMAGTSFPIDRRLAARLLGFDGILSNSIDAVSDRDVQIEFIGICAIIMMHLSRFAEELVLWSSEEWGFVRIGEKFTTGSSIMPQKRNPDMAELVRGKAGRVYGDLVALLTVMKGLPLSYNRDMQEDKGPLFDAADTVSASLDIFARMVGTLSFDKTLFEKAGRQDFLLATELADYLVRKGMPFRSAHAVVGEIVRLCLRKKIGLKALPYAEYRRQSTLFGKDLWKILDVRASVMAKKSEGSTSPREIRKALRGWKKALSRPSP